MRDQASPTLRKTPWDAHSERLAGNWEPGQHVSIFCPTRGGKTHLIKNGLMPLLWDDENPRNSDPVLFIDCKDDDPILRGVGIAVDKFPSKIKRYHQVPWWRLRVPSLFRGASRENQRFVIYDAIRQAYLEGGWTIILDEVRPLLELGLVKYLNELWERAASGGTTLVAGTQAPVRMPGAMYDQARHIYLGGVTDRRRQIRYRELGGWGEELGPALETLPWRSFLYIGPGDEKAVTRGGILKSPSAQRRVELVKAPPR
ncbi:MAG: hypothetical protein ACYDAY_11965 [Candidatus Dormibacteria bacterium]